MYTLLVTYGIKKKSYLIEPGVFKYIRSKKGKGLLFIRINNEKYVLTDMT